MAEQIQLGKGKGVRSEIKSYYEKKGVSPEKADYIAGAIAREEHVAREKARERG